MASCGGGGGGSAESAPSVVVEAQIVAAGTVIRCSGTATGPLQLKPAPPSADMALSISCPSTTLLAGRYAPTVWQLAGAGPVMTRLPAPFVMKVSGSQAAVFRDSPLTQLSLAGLQLQVRGQAGDALQTWDDPAATVALQAGLPAGLQWRWSLTQDGASFSSPWVATFAFQPSNTGVLGAMAMGDLDGSAVARLLGTGANGAAPGYEALGLSALLQGRDFRDVRLVDLDNDGRLDLVSNVYGMGCVLIGIQRAGGGFDLLQPARRDGSCIGGHGETILVADFDGDGLVDIVLPSYERVDFLKNLGGGVFSETADEVGLSYPGYIPNIEGAAALDIDLDGAVDIVMGSEVLLNDGHGHFAPLVSPFGPTRVFDEGLSVADVDGDGRFDIVKTDPGLGPRVFWGQPSRAGFTDGGWLLGGQALLTSSYGLAVGDLTGDGGLDLVVAGGYPGSTPPQVCIHLGPRSFDCRPWESLAVPGLRQDLLLFQGQDAAGRNALLARYWADDSPTATSTIMQFGLPVRQESVFRFDLRGAGGLRNQFGQSLRATCDAGGALIGLKFLDGGNGYMAQGDYVVGFASSWCSRIRLERFSAHGPVDLGAFEPGTYVVSVTAPR
jgi:hypothetical protein